MMRRMGPVVCENYIREREENRWSAFLTMREGMGGLSFRQKHRQHLQVQTGSMQMRCKEVAGGAQERSLLTAFIFSVKYKTRSSARSEDGEEELEI